MSSSEEDSKIDLLDSPDVVKKKLKRAFCEPGKIADNGVLAFVKHVVFSLFDTFVIARKEANGGDLTYAAYQSLEDDFVQLRLHPGDLKAAVEKYLNRLLEPIRETFKDPKLKKLTDNAYPSLDKKGKVVATSANDINPSLLDIRVGKIVDIEKHPDADSLYVSQIDLGDADGGTRTVVSGLAALMTRESLHERLVVVLANLKPAKMRGVESRGMILCASTDEPRQVEPLNPPPGSQPGERVFVEGYSRPASDTWEQLNPKKKVWEKLQTDLRTSHNGLAEWSGNPLVTTRGLITCKSMSNAPIK
ncbi:unnamed protein product [Medioppia subpectinata]|uniref:tRNA-binding domain-containing protein n=1 Tax=Medioppia subpectinata TaxID=1979941 RepID=A0A7R9KGJ0_9ACAR|nr:unnamed protein product [Medioppia subpectinata]CAG2102943.1 unnamed protein product [Medioppia subpectinata]